MFLVAFLGSIVGAIIGITVVEVLVRLAVDVLAAHLGPHREVARVLVPNSGLLDTIQSPSLAASRLGAPRTQPDVRAAGNSEAVLERTPPATGQATTVHIAGEGRRPVVAVLPRHGAALTIGSGADDMIRLDGWPEVVPNHVILQRSERSWRVALDNNDTAAYLDGRALGSRPQVLALGSELHFGSARLRLYSSSPQKERG